MAPYTNQTIFSPLLLSHLPLSIRIVLYVYHSIQVLSSSMHLLPLLRCLSLTESSLHCVALFDYRASGLPSSATFVVSQTGLTATPSQVVFPFNTTEAKFPDDPSVTMGNQQSQVDRGREVFPPADDGALESRCNVHGESHTERTVYVEPTLPKHHDRAQLEAASSDHYDTKGGVTREELIDKGTIKNAISEIVPAFQQQLSCCVCSDTYFVTALIPCNNCGRSTCVGCLMRYVEVCQRSKLSRPKLCCRSSIPAETLVSYVPPVILRAYKVKAEEFEDPDPTYCYACSAYLRLRNAYRRSVLCWRCDEETCRRCKQGTKYHKKSDELSPTMCVESLAEQKFLRTSRELGWKCCPYCRNALEKIGGCNYMEYVLSPFHSSMKHAGC